MINKRKASTVAKDVDEYNICGNSAWSVEVDGGQREANVESRSNGHRYSTATPPLLDVEDIVPQLTGTVKMLIQSN